MNGMVVIQNAISQEITTFLDLHRFQLGLEYGCYLLDNGNFEANR